MSQENPLQNKVIVLVIGILLIHGCTIDDTKNGLDVEDPDGIDSSRVDDSEGQDKQDKSLADIITHATPGIPEVKLNSSHSGWKNANCFSCHNTLHTSGYTSISHCSTCHGANGARLIHHDDPRQNCGECHDNVHPGVAFPDPQQCISCHLAHNAEDKPSCSHTDDYDVVIIGGGGGGLAAAATLLKEGFRVLILEQHYKTGGAMVNFKRGDYTFEASLHAFDGMSVANLKSLGIFDRLTLTKGEYMYRSVYPDLTLDIPADASEYKKNLLKQFPDQTEQIEHIFATLTSMNLFEYLDKSVLDLMEAHNIHDMQLITVLTQLVGYIGASLDDINAALYIGMWASFHNFGYYYLHGGSQAITNALTDSILDMGGEILLNTLVTDIIIEDGKARGVQTANGGCFKGKYIISNINQPDLYLKLVGTEHLPAEVVASFGEKEYAPPVSLVYLGVDRDYRDFFPEGAHEIWVNARYADQWFSEGPECDPNEGISIANYSAHDPMAAPEGKNVLVLTFLIDYECHDQWRLGLSYQDYKKYKLDLADYYIGVAEKYLPDLRKHLEVVEVASPTTVEHYTLNPEGTWAGWYPEFDYTPLNMMNEERHLTPISNLYQTGAWATTGGQMVVLNSGMVAAEMVMRELRNE